MNTSEQLREIWQFRVERNGSGSVRISLLGEYVYIGPEHLAEEALASWLRSDVVIPALLSAKEERT